MPILGSRRSCAPGLPHCECFAQSAVRCLLFSILDRYAQRRPCDLAQVAILKEHLMTRGNQRRCGARDQMQRLRATWAVWLEHVQQYLHGHHRRCGAAPDSVSVTGYSYSEGRVKVHPVPNALHRSIFKKNGGR